METTQFLVTIDNEEKMGKEGGNKEEETGMEPVSLVPAAAQVERKYSLTVPHSRATAWVLHHTKQNISLMVD